MIRGSCLLHFWYELALKIKQVYAKLPLDCCKIFREYHVLYFTDIFGLNYFSNAASTQTTERLNIAIRQTASLHKNLEQNTS